MKEIRARKKDPLEAEADRIEKAEEHRKKKAKKEKPASLLSGLEQKIPRKADSLLKNAFGTAFSLVFSKGCGIIEKTFDRETAEKDFEIRDFAVRLKGNRKELIRLKKDAKSVTVRNMVLTTVEGVVLGAFGVGLPDIVLFIGMILKGVYEISLKYGFSYDTPWERMFILKVLEASMCRGEDWISRNDEVNDLIRRREKPLPSEEALKQQMKKTADAFAAEMLILKFIQGFPVAGIVGGMGNPFYYGKIMDYVQLKYRKRYIMNKLREYQL